VPKAYAFVTITRGPEHGEHYLAVKDDGDGVPRDKDGLPDFDQAAAEGPHSTMIRPPCSAGAGCGGVPAQRC